ncbi:RidA family protein [Aquimarina muelleri]|uniref:Reactive intermediate/imine deaminase n=1 Tax=Aquimarina muelleri TaxID=279356 RepID=A0A918JWS2_9FLAO|nr:RidA family protein [Aquimarina muelleri]MCX2764434.1 RidA family protein [Aquimarina muelleri]GGX21320.1 reactive intermediate/imine deaminase [Aquimarina muelleri]
MKILVMLSCFFVFITSCKTKCLKTVDTVVFHKTHESKKSEAPFSDIVQVGNLYFLSGQIGMNHSVRELVDGGIVPETKQTLENIKAVLENHDMKMENVVKCTVILANIEDFSAFNEVYKKYFPNKPARTTFAAKGLAVGARIEIECVAVTTK